MEVAGIHFLGRVTSVPTWGLCPRGSDSFIHEAKLGLGTILMMELPQLYKIGCELLSADPNLLLCDDPKNLSCRRIWRKN